MCHTGSLYRSADILTVTTIPENTTEDHSFGFSEADPSEHLFVDLVAVWQSSQQQASTGFAETDPAYNRTRDDWIVLKTSRNQVQQIDAGFDESDPSVGSDQWYCLDADFEEKPVRISRVFSSGDIHGK